jgi:hypothetical protein
MNNFVQKEKRGFSDFTEMMQKTKGLDRAEKKEVLVNNEIQGKYQAIWNVDKNRLACIASDKYTIVQHDDVMNDVVDTFKEFNLTNVQGGVTNYGDRVFLDVCFKDKVLKDDSEEGILIGVRFSNSYDKSATFSCEPFAYRSVCINGMVLGRIFSQIKIRQIHKGMVSHGSIFDFMKKAIEIYEPLKILVSNAMAESIEWEMAESILKNLIIRKKYLKELKQMLVNKTKISRWDIYNAITNIATHGQKIRASAEVWLQEKAQSILNTSVEELSKIAIKE